MKTTIIDGKEIPLFCGCDEEWDVRKSTIGISERCSQCGYWPWVHRTDLIRGEGGIV